MLGKQLAPSAEVAQMEALQGIKNCTEMCAEFYHGLRGKGLPDDVAWGLTNTWLTSLLGGSVASNLITQVQELGEEGEENE